MLADGIAELMAFEQLHVLHGTAGVLCVDRVSTEPGLCLIATPMRSRTWPSLLYLGAWYPLEIDRVDQVTPASRPASRAATQHPI